MGLAFESREITVARDRENTQAISIGADLFQKGWISVYSELTFISPLGGTFGSDMAGKFQIRTKLKTGHNRAWVQRKLVDDLLIGTSLISYSSSMVISANACEADGV